MNTTKPLGKKARFQQQFKRTPWNAHRKKKSSKRPLWPKIVKKNFRVHPLKIFRVKIVVFLPEHPK